MKALFDLIVRGIYLYLLFVGGTFTLQKILTETQTLALEKAAKGLGSLERSTQIMTGMKLDF